MIYSAVNFIPRGISCPPLVCTTRDSLSESGDVSGGQVKNPSRLPAAPHLELLRNAVLTAPQFAPSLPPSRLLADVEITPRTDRGL